MSILYTVIVPAVTENGRFLDIPDLAWADVQEVANKEFGVFIDIDFRVPGSYGKLHIPDPHYFIDATLDSVDRDVFRRRIEPMIDNVVACYTQLSSAATE
jgi:hypothetical protein